MRFLKSIYPLLLVMLFFSSAYSENLRNDSFAWAKRVLAQEVYFDHRITFYCKAAYDERGRVTLPVGFETEKYKGRAEKIEWEHVVPAENFGRTFSEWREGHPECVDKRGPFKGRHCAEKVNLEYRRMQADMYNLYPAIGAVNAARQNYNFVMLPGVPPSFGSCAMKIEGTKVEPPEYVRGAIARTYKYMASTYPRFTISSQQKQLFGAWDALYPVDKWECTRAKRIETIQKNRNAIVAERCMAVGLW